MSQTVTSLNALFPYLPAANPSILTPDNVKLLKMLPKITEAEQLGRKYLMPVQTNSEGGVTYGDGTAFLYEDVVDSTWPEAQVDASPVVLNMKLSRSAADRLANNKGRFLNQMGLKTKSLYQEISARAEISLFYGKSPTGLGKVGAVTGTASTTLVVTFAAGQFAPGIWGGRKNHRVEVRNPAASFAGIAGHAANKLTIKGVDSVNRKVTFTGDATEIAAVAAGHVLYWRGSYVNDMLGIDAMLSTTGLVHGIDNSLDGNELWKGTYVPSVGAISMSKVLGMIGQGVAIGGTNKSCKMWINSAKWEVLNSELAALKASAEYDPKKAEAGAEGIIYHCQVGTVTVIGSSIIKDGDTFIFDMDNLKRVGVKDINFGSGKEGANGEKEYFENLEASHGVQLQCSYEFAILFEKPAAAIKGDGIT